MPLDEALHVISLLPLSTILLATSIEMLISWVPSKERKTIGYATTIAVAAVAIAVWAPGLRDITGPHETPPLRAAEVWVARNIPRDKQLVVHDSIWTDLVQRYRFQPRPIIVHKLDSDPAVAPGVTRIDCLIVPNLHYADPNARSFAALLEARKHAERGT